jgi:AsmA protein
MPVSPEVSMRGKLRTIAIAAALVVLVLLIVPFLVPVNSFRPTIEERLTTALGRKVEVGNLSLSLFGGSLTAGNLSIADDPKFSPSPFLTAKSLKVGVEMIPLIFSHSLHLTGIAMERPEVNLLHDASGKWNFSSLGGASANTAPLAAKPANAPSSPGGAADLSVKKLELADGRITIGPTKSSKRGVYDKVNVVALNVSMTSSFPVKITASLPGRGSFKLDGTLGPVNEKDAALSPLEAQLTVDGLDLASSGVIDASAGLGGLLDVSATLASRNGQARAQGKAKFTKLLLVAGGSPSTEPAAVDFSTNYDLRKSAGTLNPSAIKIGNAAAHLSGTYETPGDTTIVNIKLEGQNMPARDLEAFLPALGIHVPKGASLQSGTLNTKLNIEGPTNRLVTKGTVGLYAAKLAGFDLGSKLSAISGLAGLKTGADLEIQQLTANLRMAPDGLRAQNFNAIVPSLGNLIGAGTIDSRNNLDFKVIATLASAAGQTSIAGAVGGLEGLLGKLGAAGGTGKGMRIPFLIQGTTSDPRFVPDVAGLAGAMLKSQLSGTGQPPNTNQGNNPLSNLDVLFKKKKP